MGVDFFSIPVAAVVAFSAESNGDGISGVVGKGGGGCDLVDILAQ